MIVKLDTSQRPPWKRGDTDAPELRIDLDENYDPPLEEPWNTYYGDRDWKEYYDFNEDELYIVLQIAAVLHDPSFRVAGGSIKQEPFRYYPLCPYIYQADMFIIVDETIPEDWVVFASSKPHNICVPVRELNIYTYSNLVAFGETTSMIYTLGAYPQEVGLLGFTDILEGKKKVIEKIAPYLERIMAQQTALNQGKER